MKKVKLKDMTCEDYKKWLQKNCCTANCKNCIFDKVNCSNNNNYGWINNKDLYSEKFLNQEVEI